MGDAWGTVESVLIECEQNTNRYLNVGANDTVVGPHVVGSCEVTDLTPDFIDITTLKMDSANGTPMYPDTSGWIKGVVYSIDFDGNNGYSFYMHENGTGINIFNFNDVSGYQVEMGDSLHIMGSMDFYAGLSEWFADSIVVVSQGNAIPDPTVVPTVSENTESQLVRINDVTLADPGQWPTTTGNANVDIVTPGNDTIDVFIDGDTDIDGMVPVPSGAFDIVGIGGQRDFSEPHDDNYQLLPRMQSDIILAASDTPSVYFTQSSITVDESAGSINISIGIQDANNDTTKVDVVLTGGTATQGADFNFTSPVTVVFPPNSTSAQSVTVDIIDDMDQEPDETIVLELQNATNDANIVTTTATITIEDNDVPTPVYDIAEINGVDANGVADSGGVVCELRGVVTTIDYRDGSGLQFWMQDPTAGINVFNFVDVSNYTVTEGDSIHVIGEIDQFNGLIEIIPDSIGLISQGNDLPEPMEVDSLTEDTESELLVLRTVELTDSIYTGGGYNMQGVFNGDTIIIRVDDGTDLYNMPFPDGVYYDITGVGTQFDQSSPYTEGYQLQIRRFADFEELMAPTADFDYVAAELAVDFTDMSTNGPTAWKWHFGDGDSSTMQHPSHTYADEGSYEVCLTASNMVGSDQYCDSVTVMVDGIADIGAQIGLEVFPVPTEQQVNIRTDIQIAWIEVVDPTGKLLVSDRIDAPEAVVDLSNYSNGLYVIRIGTDQGVAVRSVLKQ
jgi:hypothetical protein